MIQGHLSLQQLDRNQIYNPDLNSEESQQDITGYHAVTAVGWGHSNSYGLDYVIMKNSWGTDWADEGYFKLALVDTEVGTCNMFKLNSWMMNHRDNNNLFFDKEPLWSNYDE